MEMEQRFIYGLYAKRGILTQRAIDGFMDELVCAH
jgi:hypothetical protein